MTPEPARRSAAGRCVLRAAASLALGYILLPLVLISWLAFFGNPVVSRLTIGLPAVSGPAAGAP